ALSTYKDVSRTPLTRGGIKLASGINSSIRQHQSGRWFSDAHSTIFDAIRGNNMSRFGARMD
ncbi:MAG TPA: hypothetical protein VK639_17205, partial [Terriglobales bacterium]|nr:hypothetical protein [Terriglobales bacterium]